MWMPVLLLAFAGLFFFGLFGGAVGLCLGLWLRKNIPAHLFQAHVDPQKQAQAQTVFFQATFIAMGRLAKVDGRVNEKEIEQATQLMSQMRLSPDQRNQAIAFFNQGKSGQVDFRDVLYTFKHSVTSRSLLHVFMEIQLQAAYADGELSRAESAALNEMCQLLNISQFTFEMLHRRFQAQQSFYQREASDRYRQGYQSHSSYGTSDRSALHEAYKALGIQSSASDHEVKRAYRKLMSEHHPDKLASKGLPEEMMELTKRKTQEIQAAYDLIQKYRKK